MDLIFVVIVAVVIGFLVWLLTTQVPMPATYARTIQVIALILIVFWIFSKVVTLPNVLPR